MEMPESDKDPKTFEVGEGVDSEHDGPLAMTAKRLTKEEIAKIREQINSASSLEEVKRLERLLQVGQVPSTRP
jgi:hypothetical protein